MNIDGLSQMKYAYFNYLESILCAYSVQTGHITIALFDGEEWLIGPRAKRGCRNYIHRMYAKPNLE